MIQKRTREEKGSWISQETQSYTQKMYRSSEETRPGNVDEHLYISCAIPNKECKNCILGQLDLQGPTPMKGWNGRVLRAY